MLRRGLETHLNVCPFHGPYATSQKNADCTACAIRGIVIQDPPSPFKAYGDAVMFMNPPIDIIPCCR
jgi:hypothetical protein